MRIEIIIPNFMHRFNSLSLPVPYFIFKKVYFDAFRKSVDSNILLQMQIQ